MDVHSVNDQSRPARPEAASCEGFTLWLRRSVAGSGRSLRQIAASIGISTSALSELHNGRSCPQLSTVYLLARHFQVDPEYLLRLANLPSYQQEAGELPELPDPELTQLLREASSQLPADELEKLKRYIRFTLAEVRAEGDAAAHEAG